MTDVIERDIPSISEYYRGKKVFVTGGTGFIGKVLLEKLLRSCPGVEKIYYLVRPKRNQDIQERNENLAKCKLFDKLREDQPDFADKLHPINGDIQQVDLGISASDRKLLEDQVNVVFHSAATIRFDEELRLAVALNVLGVRRMVELCKKIKQLEAFVHVSTAYANCDRPFIEETIYSPPVEPQNLLNALEWMDDDMVKTLTPKLIGQKPNTYTYTKQLAEWLLLQEGADLPVAILRPSIVGAAWKEPFPGWIDNFNGPSGIYVATGKGILRNMRGEESAVADIVPVDMVVNMMVSASWYTAVMKPKQFPVFHCSTGGINPFKWGEMEDIVINFFKRIPLESCFRRPKASLTSSGIVQDYYSFVNHMLPAYVVDFGYLVLGKKPRMVKIFKKLNKAIESLSYFTCHSWEWTNNNFNLLTSHMTAEDQKAFAFDPRVLHWPSYLENFCLGTKRYVLNEDMAGLPAARSHLKKLGYIKYTFNTILAVVLWRWLIARSQIARNVWSLIMSLVLKFVRYFHITSSMQS